MGKHAIILGLCLVLAACNAPNEPTDATNAVWEEPAENAAGAGGNVSENTMAGMDNAADNATGDNASGGHPTVLPISANIWCPVIRARTSQARCDDLTEQQANLEKGIAAFNPPREMTMGQATRVYLPIGRVAHEAAVVRAAGGPAGSAATVAVRIGRFMTATLSGSAFDIAPIGDPQRDLGGSSSETWEWDVTPTAGGTQSLRVELETFAQDENGQRTRLALFRSPPISVDVTVTGEQKRKAALEQAGREIGNTTPLMESLTKWLGLLAALLLAAGIVWWRVRNFGRKPKDDDPEPE